MKKKNKTNYKKTTTLFRTKIRELYYTIGKGNINIFRQ